MSTIRLENVVKRFGNFTAVDKINLTIEDKEFVEFHGKVLKEACKKGVTKR